MHHVKVSSLDLYGKGFAMTFDGGSKIVRSKLGVLLSILTISFFVIFAVIKYEIMIDYADTNIMFSTLRQHHDVTAVESDRLGFNVAFGLSNFDNSTGLLEDPDYGTLRAVERSWGIDGIFQVQEKVLPHRRCTLEDFYMNEDGELDPPSQDSYEFEKDKAPFFFNPNPVQFSWYKNEL